jgi:hypothetical protein
LTAVPTNPPPAGASWCVLCSYRSGFEGGGVVVGCLAAVVGRFEGDVRAGALERDGPRRGGVEPSGEVRDLARGGGGVEPSSEADPARGGVKASSEAELAGESVEVSNEEDSARGNV